MTRGPGDPTTDSDGEGAHLSGAPARRGEEGAATPARQAQLTALALKKKLAETEVVLQRYKQTAAKLKEMTEQRALQVAKLQKQVVLLKSKGEEHEQLEQESRRRAEAAEAREVELKVLLETQQEALTRQIMEVQLSGGDLGETTQRYETRLQELQERLRWLEEQQRDANAHQEGLATQLGESRASLDQARQRNDLLESRLIEVQRELDQRPRDSDLEELEKALLDTQELAHGHEAMLIEREQELTDLRQLLADAERHVALSSSTSQEIDDSLTQLRQELTDSNSTARSLQETMAAQDERLQSVIGERDQALSQITQLQVDLDDHQAELLVLQDEHTTLLEAFDELTQERTVVERSEQNQRRVSESQEKAVHWLESQLVNKGDELLRHQASLRALEQDFTARELALRGSLAEQGRELGWKESALTWLEEHLLHSELERTHLNGQLQSLELQFQLSLHAQLQDLDEERRFRGEERTLFERQLSNLDAQATQAAEHAAQQERLLSTQVAEAEAHRDQLRGLVAIRDAELDEVRLVQDMLRAATATLEGRLHLEAGLRSQLQRQLGLKGLELSELQSHALDLELRLDESRRRLSESQRVVQELATLRAELSQRHHDLNQTLGALRDHSSELEISRQRESELREQLAKTKAGLQEQLTQAQDELREQLTKAQEGLAQVHIHQQARQEQWQEELNYLQGQVQLERVGSQSRQVESSVYLEALARLEGELSEKEISLARLQKREQRQQLEWDDVTQYLGQLERDLLQEKSRQSRLTLLQRELQQSQDKVRGLEQALQQEREGAEQLVGSLVEEREASERRLGDQLAEERERSRRTLEQVIETQQQRTALELQLGSLQTELDNTRRQVAQEKGEMEGLLEAREDLLLDLQGQLEDLRRLRDGHDHVVANMQNQLEDARVQAKQQVKQVLAKFEQAREVIQAQKGTLDSLKQQVEDAHTDLQFQRQRTHEQHKRQTQLQSSHKQLEAQLASAEEGRRKVESDLSAADALLRQALVDLEESRRLLRQSEASEIDQHTHIIQLTQQVAAKEAEVARLSDREEELTGEHEALFEELSSAQSEIEQARNDADRQAQRVQAAETRLLQIEEQLRQVQDESLAEHHRAEEAVAEIGRLLEQLKAEQLHSQQEGARATESEHQLSQARQKIQQTVAKFQELKANYRDKQQVLQETQSQLEDTQDTLQEVLGELGLLQSQHSLLQEQGTSLQERLTEQTEEKDRALGQIHELLLHQAESTELRLELENRLAELESQKDSQEAELIKLGADLAQLRKEREETLRLVELREAELDEMALQITDLQDKEHELEEARVQLSDLQVRAAQLEQEADKVPTLQASLSKNETRVRQLQTEKESLHGEIEQIQERRGRVEAALTRTVEKLRAAAQRINQLEEEVNQAHSDSEAMMEELETHIAEKEAVQNRLQETESARDSLQEQKRELERSVQLIVSENQELTELAQGKDSELAALSESQRQLREELARRNLDLKGLETQLADSTHILRDTEIQIGEFEQFLEVSSQQTEQLEQRLDESRAKIRRLEAEKLELARRLDEPEYRRDTATELNEQMKVKLAHAVSALQQEKQLNAQLEKDNEQLRMRSSIEVSVEAYTALLNKLEEIKQEKDELEEAHLEVSTENADLHDRLQTLEEKMAHLQDLTREG